MQDACSIKAFCDSHAISRGSFYNARRAGIGPCTFKLGSRTLISREAAETWRRGREAAASKPARANRRGLTKASPMGAVLLSAEATLDLETNWCRLWLPYVLERVKNSDDGKYRYLPLNRFYKPLGCPSRGWVRYEDFIERLLVFKTQPDKLHFWCSHRSFDGKYYLYSENRDSWPSYTARLALMLRHVEAAQ